MRDTRNRKQKQKTMNSGDTAAEVLYGTKEINKSSSSEIPRSRRIYPSSKKEALTLITEGVEIARISVSEAMGKGIIAYYQFQGMASHLPSDKHDRVSWINLFHRELAIENPYWPEDIPFWIVYHYFIKELKYGEIQVKGANISTHVNAFKEWIRKDGTSELLEKANRAYNPDAPKQITDQITETEEDRQVKAQGYVNFAPAVVKQQIQTIERMWGTAKEAIKAFPGAESYVQRLYNTRKKMRQEGNWPSNPNTQTDQ